MTVLYEAYPRGGGFRGPRFAGRCRQSSVPFQLMVYEGCEGGGKWHFQEVSMTLPCR